VRLKVGGLGSTESVLVTGGAGFIGSHAAEHFARNGFKVIVLDNLSRARNLKSAIKTETISTYNWNYLKRIKNIKMIEGDIRDIKVIERIVRKVDNIIHSAAQVAVTTSLLDPRTDFEVNVLGTLNILEAARKSKRKPAVIFCSTNKVYGKNVDKIPIREEETRYVVESRNYRRGVDEHLSVDLCEHTPYGCSKLAADIYVQDYGIRNEIDTCVFRMSCIYGTRQFGCEDQGWVSHFVISTIMHRPITIFGNGKQVRDILFVSDLVGAFEKFLDRRSYCSRNVYNIGGGSENTISLLELLYRLEDLTGKKSVVSFKDFRPGDQKMYISDISKAKRELGWRPEISVEEGIEALVQWATSNVALFT